MPQEHLLILFSFVLNITIGVWALLRSKEAYSLYKIFWLFSIFFLSVVPLIQYLLGQFPWERHPSVKTLMKANTLILVYQLLYLFIYLRAAPSPQTKSEQHSPLHFHTSKSIFLFILTCVLSIVGSNQGQFWVRANGLSIEHNSLQLLADKTLKGLCLMATIGILHLYQHNKLNKTQLLCLLLLGMIAQFPTAVPRYWLFTFYLTWLIFFAGKWLALHRRLFDLMLSAGLLLLFPLMSLFRYGILFFKQEQWRVKTIFSFSYLGGDFDAYSSLCSTLDYVQQHGISWGKQLATVLLFFIPRSIWPDKSVGTGALVNVLPDSDFRNFSSPFIAEGYINGGIVGLLIFVLLAAWLCRKYDDLYHTSGGTSFVVLLYPAALAMFFFLLRGDLLSSFAYAVGIFSSAYLAFRFMKEH